MKQKAPIIGAADTTHIIGGEEDTILTIGGGAVGTHNQQKQLRRIYPNLNLEHRTQMSQQLCSRLFASG
jgi:hypothetical protein